MRTLLFSKVDRAAMVMDGRAPYVSWSCRHTATPHCSQYSGNAAPRVRRLGSRARSRSRISDIYRTRPRASESRQIAPEHGRCANGSAQPEGRATWEARLSSQARPTSKSNVDDALTRRGRRSETSEEQLQYKQAHRGNDRAPNEAVPPHLQPLPLGHLKVKF